ncbi:uncharacterized protein LOC124194742 isoform X4 [Daphnia pulex]|nr:uncharacterized protein LOC124194742 isoform X4 [Daphnia pulex]
MEREELMDNLTPRRAVRERTRSESGKENSIRPVVPQRQRRSERTLLRERYTDAVMATTLAAVAALSASGDDGGDDRQSTTESPIEFCTVTDSALPSDSDHGPWGDQHSSEEELECINGAEEESMAHDLLTTPAASSSGTALRFGPSAFGPPRFCPNQHNNNNQQQPRKVVQPQGPEKRKWGQVNHRRLSERMKSRPRSAVLLHHGLMIENEPMERSISSVGAAFDCSASSDDEVQSLVGGPQDSPLPLEFRTSPPEGAHRPTRSLSPPPKFFLADREDMASPLSAAAMLSLHAEPAALSVANGNNIGSPRKRHRHAHRSHHHIQRPCLDFEKMQQVENVFTLHSEKTQPKFWQFRFFQRTIGDGETCQTGIDRRLRSHLLR